MEGCWASARYYYAEPMDETGNALEFRVEFFQSIKEVLEGIIIT
jgi:hypothetical protein